MVPYWCYTGAKMILDLHYTTLVVDWSYVGTSLTMHQHCNGSMLGNFPFLRDSGRSHSRNYTYQTFGVMRRRLCKCARAQVSCSQRRKRAPDTATQALYTFVGPVPRPSNPSCTSTKLPRCRVV